MKLIVKLIRKDKYITTTELSEKLNVTRRTIARDMEKLKEIQQVIRIGGDKGGHWQINNNK